MNKVLVTGLAVGKDVGVCSACNFDYEWVFNNPSVLLWADKIYISEVAWERAVSGKSDPENIPISKSLKLIFEMASGEGLIEVIKPKEVITKEIKDNIISKVEKDREKLLNLFPNSIKIGDEEKLPGSFFIEGEEYCLPYLYAVYVNILLSKVYDAHSLFNSSVYTYCKYKFGLANTQTEKSTEIVSGFQNIFSTYFPNNLEFPHYVLSNKNQCKDCKKTKLCKDDYLINLEKNLKNFLKWRDYDEVQQLKNVLERITKIRNKQNGVITAEEITDRFSSVELTLRKRMLSIFPKVKRWSNILTILSLPTALAGGAIGENLITIPAAALTVLAQVTNKIIDTYSSKYSWIVFKIEKARLPVDY